MQTELTKLDISKRIGVMPKVKKVNKSKVREWFKKDQSENLALLNLCREHWDALEDFRTRRVRNRRYLRGYQWQDKIEDPENEGSYITEEEYIKRQGKIPLKQNFIRQIVKNLEGQHRLNNTQTMVVTRNKENQTEGEMMSTVLRAAKDLNRSKKLDAAAWRELMMSGMPIQKLGYKFWHDRDVEDLYMENVVPNRIFFNTDVADPRLTDLTLIGEIRDTDLDDIISAFAENEDEANVIRNWYSHKTGSNKIVTHKGASAERIDDLDFDLAPEDKCRVIEVWQQRSEWRVYAHDYYDGSYQYVDYSLEEIAAINEYRKQLFMEQGIAEEDWLLIEAKKQQDRFWYVKYLTPNGNTLYESETPYAHKSHPYTVLMYPMVDGEVWGLIEDILDQQRYINRLITMMDFIMGASAKGVLLVPEDAISDEFPLEKIADEWTKFNGVIKIKVKAGQSMPEQIASKSINIGTTEMLSLQMKLIQDIAGVSSAMQGHTAKSGTPSSLYMQEAQNSSVNSKDMMEEFAEFKRERDLKALKILLQFYQSERIVTVPGVRNSFVKYDPNQIKDLVFDVSVSQTNDTPVYRQVVDESLFKLLEGGLIDLKLYLEHSSMPFAEKLLDSITKQQEMLDQQQVSPELLAQLQGAQQQLQLDPQKQAILDKLMQAA